MDGTAEIGMSSVDSATGRDVPHTRLRAILATPSGFYCGPGAAAPSATTFPRSRPNAVSEAYANRADSLSQLHQYFLISDEAERSGLAWKVGVGQPPRDETAGRTQALKVRLGPLCDVERPAAR